MAFKRNSKCEVDELADTSQKHGNYNYFNILTHNKYCNIYCAFEKYLKEILLKIHLRLCQAHKELLNGRNKNGLIPILTHVYNIKKTLYI